MGDHVLFFYGTLMAPQILHRVIHGSATPSQWQKDLLTFRPAILHGFRRYKVRGADYPGIIASSAPGWDSASLPGVSAAETTPTATASASVLGTVVSGLTDGDIHRLDIFEGGDYTRQKVNVRILMEALADAHPDGGHGHGEKNSDRHLKDVLEAAGAEFADEGEEVEAETYVWTSGRGRLGDVEWDFEAFKRDKMAWWVAADERDW
ncbi:putative disease resistance protein Aig2 [Aspergillus californicus]